MQPPITIIGLNYSPEPTGIAPYTRGAAIGLAERDWPDTVITGYPHYPQWRIPADYSGWRRRELLDGIPVLRLSHPVPRHGEQLKRALMEAVFGTRAAFSRWGRSTTVLVVSPALISAAVVVLRARLTRTPVVVWVQDIYTLAAAQTGSSSAAARVLRSIERWTLTRATRVIAIHERFRDFISRELDVDPDRIDVVRNWTHLQDSPQRSAEVRRRLGWPDDVTIALHAGNMGAKQNLENVVLASQVAARRGDPVRFVLLGDGNRRDALRAMGENPNLQFIDPLPDAEFAEALTSADLLVVNELPGMTEMSVPSKLTSYFNTGLPVIAAVDAGSVTADELALSEGGLRVEPNDPEALVDAALRLRADPETAARLGANGRRHRNQALNVDRAIEEIAGSLSAARASHSGSQSPTTRI